MKMNIRSLLLTVLLLLLLLPALNMRFAFFKSLPLGGDVHLAPNAWFNIRSWMDGSYQQQKELYLNDNIGLRPELVRTNNEIDYLLFRKPHAANVVFGKEGCLFEQGYIDARNGKDFLGHERWRGMARRLRYIQDTLARAGKQLLFIFTPSKGRYYPEYFPNIDRLNPSAVTNYDVLKHYCDSFGVHNIDFNGWFLRLKPVTPHPLFSKQGIHWTRWAAIRAADSFNRNLEQRLGIEMPNIILGKDICSTTPRDGEDDIAHGLNLWKPVTTETWCYTDVAYDEDSATQKPTVVFITDSFFWTWAADQEPQHCYKDWEFWYYFNEIWSDDVFSGKRPLGHISDDTWMDKLAHTDALVIMLTEINLVNVGDRCTSALYTRLGGKD